MPPDVGNYIRGHNFIHGRFCAVHKKGSLIALRSACYGLIGNLLIGIT